ncbi:hypothetical protein BWI93_11625 [Siphonobacter sp. BAB-5385]|uniref:DinB family protein n=1 Tax=unclassified Siphonobacter TaxID=2635712 RepID=UPI000B9E5604|nr:MULTISPECIES: DinB family protein [unclassified Siphonobacter]OZI07998.1 hypothetical protein BWI93_11625 [Siphonobacter sp. BAB-5385]PMD98457.1 hypothetical protein BWI97_04680 [Siphonobacter sp. BAB-5405]
MMLAYYISQLESLFNGQPWLDETLLKKTGKLSSEQAFQRPYPHVHSVAEILAHLIAWRQVLIKRLEGNYAYQIQMQGSQDWPSLEQLRVSGWKALQEQLVSNQTRLIALLKHQPQGVLSTHYNEQGHTFEYLINGIIQHDLYHLGQIGLVISMLKHY